MTEQQRQEGRSCFASGFHPRRVESIPGSNSALREIPCLDLRDQQDSSGSWDYSSSAGSASGGSSEDPDPGHKCQREAINPQPWLLSRGPTAQGGSPAAALCPRHLGRLSEKLNSMGPSGGFPAARPNINRGSSGQYQGSTSPHLYFQTFIPREGT